MTIKNEPAIAPNTLNGTMMTLSGTKFDLVNPKPEMVNIDDIVVGLSNQSHFNGQSEKFFSVAQHCIMVHDEFVLKNPKASAGLKMIALLHDAPETYTGDIIKPLKVLLPGVAKIENRIWLAICEAFNLDFSMIAVIKPYDLYIQNIEYNAFYRDGSIHYLTPEQARSQFLDRFFTLQAEMKL